MQKDKVLHFLAGAIAFAIVFLFCLFPLLWPFQHGVIAGVLAGFVAGAGKEGLDWYSNKKRAAAGLTTTHSVEWNDFFATAAGALAAGAVAMYFG